MPKLPNNSSTKQRPRVTVQGLVKSIAEDKRALERFAQQEEVTVIARGARSAARGGDK